MVYFHSAYRKQFASKMRRIEKETVEVLRRRRAEETKRQIAAGLARLNA